MMAGIAAGAWRPGYALQSGLIASLCVAWLTLSLIRRRPSRFAPLFTLFLCGYLSLQPWTPAEFPQNHIIRFTDGKRCELMGRIASPVVQKRHRLQFILAAESLEKERKNIPVAGKIRVTVAGESLDLSRGDAIAFSGRLRPIRDFRNPDGFDYRRYMAFQGVWASVHTGGQRIVLLERPSRKGLLQSIETNRKEISELIDETVQEPCREVLKALIVGEKYGIPPTLRDAFNRAGVSHLLAISGLHVGIVGAAAFFLFSWLLSHVQLFLLRAWTKKGAALLALFPVIVYGLLAGMSPSTQRAVIMVGVFLAAYWFEKEHDAFNTLALAAMLILMVHPPALFSVSFQLSFTAVFAILYGLSKWRIPPEFDDSLRIKLGKKLLSFVLVSLFAILGVLPLVMRYFNQTSLVGLGANLIAVPLIGFIVVPLGLLSALVSIFSAKAAAMGFLAGAMVLKPALQVITYISDFPLAAVKTITPSLFEIVCYYLFLWAVGNVRQSSPTRYYTPPESSFSLFQRLHALHRWKSARIILAVVVAAMIADASYWLRVRSWREDLRVTVMDVGQGSAALVEFPRGPCMLVDGGGFSDNSIFDVGARVTAPVLWRRKIKSVDILALSHPNTDHLNGLTFIADHFNVQTLWSNNEPSDGLGYERFMEALERERIHILNFETMPREYEIEGVRVRVLHPPRDFMEKRNEEPWRDSNNNSLVLQLQFGAISILFPGDIEARAETELVALEGDRLRSTVLIAPHHGSKTSSSPLFLEKVNPEIVIISSGWRNRKSFPAPEVLERYEQRGCRVYRTHDSGAITLTTDGDTLEIETFVK